ncbi:C39 family peptidase [Paenibacillus allorhizosphaerae]|uniref:Peptidase C39-like domain-containing protein n=1 Tax=Paenibacillus allorhizosphaerae TaxID=2849866 RepID=A0ABN7THX3_9BACL|nr:C39 family peptidase [Paenibacillus allorhizosphaerae]CAG7622381.1 hypothetical protein PAECIP111802_00819 [Paenibacillus allorhizosphaerae]
MTVLWKGIQVAFGYLLIAGLLFASTVFGVLLYGKITGREWFRENEMVAYAENNEASATVDAVTSSARVAQAPALKELPKKAMLEAPLVFQKPELPSGCELTSLTMLLQYYGVNKSKMELLPEMKRDSTPIRYNKDGTIAYWGNPNIGFVGEITGSAKGFGIYHAALFDLLKEYVPSAVDLTREPFSKLERQVSEGFPVVAWTTIDYQVPEKWMTWDTDLGPIQTTFMEHAVLIVGYDEQSVYVNDPLTGKRKIEKSRFIATWEAMGRQALSYTEAAKS